MSTDMGDGFSRYMIENGVVPDHGFKHERGAKIDAVLHDAIKYVISGKEKVAGRIEADSSNRFKDGAVVYTSQVVAVFGNIVKTASGTVYYVASWRVKA